MKPIIQATSISTVTYISNLLIGLTIALTQFFTAEAYSQDTLKTYCNPINIDYGYSPIPAAIEQVKHRATADPLVVAFKGKFFLFSTNQHGYWWSSNMASWNFIPRKFLLPRHKVYDDLCAPAAFVLGDSLLLIGSSNNPDFPIWASTNPATDDWHVAIDSFPLAAWDPAFFADDDGRLYLYFGSSNLYPIYGCEVNRATLRPQAAPKPLISLNDSIHGWERFGEYNDNTFLPPFIEGAWMNKHNGHYYLQYAAPGTEFSGYADGVYIGSNPLGPFRYQEFNPFSYKPGGFARGAGHGATFCDYNQQWWHISTIAIGVKNNFERRIGMWPAYFDADGTLYSQTAFGDYPHYLNGKFTEWMLLNYQKPVTVSSTLYGYYPNFAVDEDIRTYWSASTGNAGEWICTDLLDTCRIYAFQVNYADQDVQLVGKQMGIYHQYRVWGSLDGKSWSLLIDKSENKTDVPHDYVELSTPVEFRFLKLENLHVPAGKFAISGFRVFGKANLPLPESVEFFSVLRGNSEPRNAWLKWKLQDNATGYLINFGVRPDKLYGSIMVYGHNEYYFSGMDRDKTYYFTITPFNESGCGNRSAVVKSEIPLR
ncbi:MAG TPA: family 43 glycosylhydrolase [Tenuifilaceae bacterium]|nr:family 43 glycosylhydrolase [Tenuifilaceae bacterium]